MHKDRGYAIPLTLLVAGVILALGMSGATLSSSDLKLANQQYNQERARQIAEIGLALKAYQVAPVSSDFAPAISAHPDDKVKVDIYDNRLGDLPANSGCPVSCPTGCMFWLATGRAYSGNQLLSEVRLGSLVRPGSREGSAGAQVRFLQATPGIHYSVVSATGIAVPDGDVAATNNTLPGESPTAFLTSNRAIQMGNPTSATLLGQVKLSPGLAAGDFTDIAEAGLVANTGGQFSLPPYAPPTLANNFGVVNVGTSQNLTPGRYQQVTLQAGAVLRLDGCYHIRKLIVGPGGGQLHVALDDHAALYLDELDTSSAPLDFRNLNKSADLRIELAPVAASSRQVAFRAVHSGGALVVAPGYDVQVSCDAEHKVRGSILAQQLKLDIPAGGEFIYDQSTEARPSSEVRSLSAPASATTPRWTLAGIRTL